MHSLTIAAQIIIALSIAFVWIYHFSNVVNEFHEYHLSDLVRSTVGAAKISLATLLVAGIWHPDLVLIPAALMALLMVCAIIAHLRVHHTWQKSVPAFLLLLLCLLVISQHLPGKVA
jgi:hypothetical protein